MKMKLDAKAFANGSAIVVGALYIICVVLVAIAPDFFLRVTNSWIHAIDITKIKNVRISSGSFFLGLISIVAVAWLVDYFLAVVYNSLVKKSEQ